MSADFPPPPPPFDPDQVPPPPPSGVFEGYQASANSSLPSGAGFNHRQHNPIEPPLEDPAFGGDTVAAIKATIQTLRTRSWDFFYGMQEERSPAPALIYAYVIYVCSNLINTIVNMIGGQQMQALQKIFSDLNLSPEMGSFMTYGGIAQLFIIPFSAAFSLFIIIIVMFASVKIWGVFTKGFSFFVRVCCWSFTPMILMFIPIGIIPYIGTLIYSLLALAAWVLALILMYRGIRPHCEKQDGYIIGALLTPLLLCCLCLIVGMVAFAGAIAAAASQAG